MFNHASGQLLPEHTWNPRCAQNFSSTHVHVKEDIRATAARARNPRHIRTQGTKRCSCSKTAALARHKHTWISLRAKRHVTSKRLLRSHAASTLGPRSVRKQTSLCDNTAAFARCEHTWISLRTQEDLFIPVHATALLRSHAASTLGSLSVLRKTCSCDSTAAFARHKHTWISLRGQRGMFRRNVCCREHTWISLRSKRHVTSKRLLRFSRREHTWISLRADARSSFYSQARTRPLRYRNP